MDLSSHPQEFTKKFYELVGISKNILIASHKNPDDDSISSVLSIYQILTNKYSDKNIRIIYSGDFNKRWSYFKNFEKIEIVDDIASLSEEFGLIICLDAAQYSRVSDLPDKLRNSQAKKICIDHHSSKVDDFDLIYLKPGTSSTAEHIFTLFCPQNLKIDKRLAETLLLGILGDTGVFRWVGPEKAEIMDIAKKLIVDSEVEIESLLSKYQGYSEAAFGVMKECMKNVQLYSVNEWPRFIATFVSRKFQEENDYSDEEINEAVHVFIDTYARAIKGISWGAVFSPVSTGIVKASLRSMANSTNVRLIAEGMGLGGGHDAASGMKFKPEGDEKLEPEECLNKFLQWLKDNPL